MPLVTQDHTWVVITFFITIPKAGFKLEAMVTLPVFVTRLTQWISTRLLHRVILQSNHSIMLELLLPGSFTQILH